MIPRQRGARRGVDGVDVDVDVMTMDYDDLSGVGGDVGPAAPLAWGRRPAPERRPVWRGILPPPRDADFGTKLAYYRRRHSTVGMRAAHLVGVPAAAVGLPLLFVHPKSGLACLAAAGALEVGGHTLFEQDTPHPAEDFPAHQLCALTLWSEEVADLVRGH